LVQPGDILRRPALANTLKAIQTNGLSAFYTGSIAQNLVNDINRAGGNVTMADFANYAIESKIPLSIPYRGYEFVSAPLSTSGGSLISLIFNILEHYNFSNLPAPVQGEASLGFSGNQVQVLVEAFKYAFAARTRLGDSDFTNMSSIIQLLTSKDFASAVFANISLSTTYPSAHYNAMFAPLDDHGTSHLSIMTRTQTVSLTSSVNYVFGSHVASVSTGIILNNQMTDFAVNSSAGFGLLSSPVNAPGPGHRPLSSMSPTIIFNKHEPFISVGASGGPTIITAVAQVLIHLLHHQKTVQEAVSLPRLHHQLFPNVVTVENDFPPSLINALTARGHTVEVLTNLLADGSSLGNSQVVMRQGGQFFAASDPRKQGAPAGF